MRPNKLQRMYKPLPIISMIAILSACSPGDDDASDASLGDTGAVQSSSEIDRDFDLRSTNQLDMTVMSADASAGEAYLSICRHKEQQGKSVIDYENCLVRTRLGKAPYVGSLTLPAHYDSLYAALWFYDVDVPPVIVQIPEADIDSGVIYLEL